MRKPLIAVLSRNAQLAGDLATLLADTHQVAICETLAEAREAVAQREPAGLVADFRNVPPGGQAEAALLDELAAARRGMTIVLLTQPHCPVSLQPIAMSGKVVHLPGHSTAEEVADIFDGPAATDSEGTSETHAEADEAAREAFDAAHADPPNAVLDGITRRFETSTPRMKQMLAELEVAAKHDVTILLIGETGSGKTFLSRLIHEVSPRRDEPFLTVACGALTEDLIESELFGHTKGAFTGAHADKEGKFLAAGAGTLLLDEIDVLSPEQQVKLLRVIETGEFEPVGSNKTQKSRARLVVASNLDLQPLVEQGKFRPDLYYRLNMLKFEVLPLRERRMDIPGLARKFIRQHSEKHGVKIEHIDRRLFDVLYAYPWPGNVRELENVIQRAVIYCRDGVLTEKHLPAYILAGQAGPTNDPSVRLSESTVAERNTLESQIALTEKEIIEQALFRNNFSRTNTARDLGISRVTLYNKMKKYTMPLK